MFLVRESFSYLSTVIERVADDSLAHYYLDLTSIEHRHLLQQHSGVHEAAVGAVASSLNYQDWVASFVMQYLQLPLVWFPVRFLSLNLFLLALLVRSTQISPALQRLAAHRQWTDVQVTASQTVFLLDHVHSKPPQN
jgi:hypothetical protein